MSTYWTSVYRNPIPLYNAYHLSPKSTPIPPLTSLSVVSKGTVNEIQSPPWETNVGVARRFSCQHLHATEDIYRWGYSSSNEIVFIPRHICSSRRFHGPRAKFLPPSSPSPAPSPALALHFSDWMSFIPATHINIPCRDDTHAHVGPVEVVIKLHTLRRHHAARKTQRNETKPAEKTPPTATAQAQAQAQAPPSITSFDEGRTTRARLSGVHACEHSYMMV